MKALLPLVVLVLATACPVTTVRAPSQLASFQVVTGGVFVVDATGGRSPLSVSSACLAQYNGAVPDQVKGTEACRYVVARAPVDIEVAARALDGNGVHIETFGGPVRFRVVPGELTSSGGSRWATAVNGDVRATVRSIHQYGEVRVWVEDAPPQARFDGGVMQVEPDLVEPPSRSFASGVSPIIYFEDQTLQSLQIPDAVDNRASPFIGEFVTIGRNPESGQQLLQTCAADPQRNGSQALMVVTGIEPTGFYVTDITACRQIENPMGVRTAEPREACEVALDDGGVRWLETPGTEQGRCAISRATCRSRSTCQRYMPGTFGSMFVFNFSFPDGLNEGDLLFTLSGSVQEFTSTTQIVFPAWSIAERVRLLPPEQWGKWLSFAPPVDVSYRTCGMDDVSSPFITDVLCGMSSTNLKLESLESALVKLRGVRFPQRFVNCDANGNGQVPFFCNRTERDEQGRSVRLWGNCDFDTPPAPEAEADRVERVCSQNCVLSQGPDADLGSCSEAATFIGFGQFVVELAPPGLASAGLDDSLPGRLTLVPVTATASARSTGWAYDPVNGFEARASIAVSCDVDVRYRLGDDAVVAGPGDTQLAANTPLLVRLGEGQSAIALRGVSAAGRCTVAFNPRSRVNLITKDAIPELEPNCSEADPDAERARQCRLLHTSTFDVVGHLKQVQPARPRWLVTPRGPQDLCCRPAEGAECPKPIKPCVSQ